MIFKTWLMLFSSFLEWWIIFLYTLNIILALTQYYPNFHFCPNKVQTNLLLSEIMYMMFGRRKGHNKVQIAEVPDQRQWMSSTVAIWRSERSISKGGSSTSGSVLKATSPVKPSDVPSKWRKFKSTSVEPKELNRDDIVHVITYIFWQGISNGNISSIFLTLEPRGFSLTNECEAKRWNAREPLGAQVRSFECIDPMRSGY